MLINELYQIKSSVRENDGSNLVVLVRLNREHPVFEGHFPGNPILPGVCTVQMVKEIIEKEIDKDLMLHKTGNIKYLGFVNPETTPDMQFNLKITEADHLVYHCNASIMAGGNMVCSFKGEYGIK
jgi:3-hydroxyacyl-[acyl-carrier-protein] dehydratase